MKQGDCIIKTQVKNKKDEDFSSIMQLVVSLSGRNTYFPPRKFEVNLIIN